MIKTFAVGAVVETGDFEGLAITPSGDFWLTTSQGRLFRFREGADGAHVEFERFVTGLNDICEIEGETVSSMSQNPDMVIAPSDGCIDMFFQTQHMIDCKF